MAELLSIGDLVQEGTYQVHSRFRRVVNLTDGTALVSVVGLGIDAGPVNLVVRDFDPARVSELRVERDAVFLDDRRLPFDEARVYRSTIELEPGDARALRRNLAVLGMLLIELSPEKSLAFLLERTRLDRFRDGFERQLAEHVSNCVRDILRWDVIRGVSRLRGAGFGLTPSGDDFIGGLLIGMNVLELLGVADLGSLRGRVFDSARRGSVITDSLLALARDGRVFESMKGLIEALARGRAGDIQAHTERLLSIGASSGADLGTGFYMSVRFAPAACRGWSAVTTSLGRAGGDGEALWL